LLVVKDHLVDPCVPAETRDGVALHPSCLDDLCPFQSQNVGGDDAAVSDGDVAHLVAVGGRIGA
jgi:hypothetical protein